MRSPASLCRLDETVKKKMSGDLVRGLSKTPDSSPVGSTGKGGKCVFFFFIFSTAWIHSDQKKPDCFIYLFGINEIIVRLIRKTREVPLPRVTANTFPPGRE